MKKLISLLLTLALLCTCLPVLAQENTLYADDLTDFCAQILADALKQAPVSPAIAEEGGYVFEYEEYTIYSPDAALTTAATVTMVELTNFDALLADVRGIAPGHTLDAVLEAYPLDNTSLQGTYTDAVLYIRGALPGSAGVGRVIRTGSHVQIIEHAVYTSDVDTINKSCLVYTLEKNTVIAIQVMPNAESLSLADAQAELDAASDLQEVNEYHVYTAENPAVLMREDLFFSGIDFMSVTPAQAQTMLGAPVSDTWDANGEGFLRSMQWDDLQLVFAYDSQKVQSELMLLEVYGENVEGPRNLHMGDSLESAIARFERTYDDGEILYGDGENAPYGVYSTNEDNSVYLHYAAVVEEETVMLLLIFVDNELTDMICSVL